MNINQARLNNNNIAVNIFFILYMAGFLLEMTESWNPHSAPQLSHRPFPESERRRVALDAFIDHN